MTSVLFFWILCGLAGAAILNPHKKSGTGCLAGGLLGPFGILLAWIEKSRLDREDDLRREEIRSAEIRGLTATVNPRAPEPPRDERPCPYCAEPILVRANVCKHCGRDVG